MSPGPWRGRFGVILLATFLTGCIVPLPGAESATPAPTRPVAVSPAAPDSAASLGLDPDSGLALVDLAALPPEATETLRLIDVGGPFPYRQDGAVFENREGILPEADRGYYHEYTVETPGSADRGARRIVVGNQGEAYWTDDHYASFRRIAP